MSSDAFGIVSPHPPIFVPEVGGSEAHVAQASLDALALAGSALATFAPDTMVLISPHAPLAADAFVVDTSERLEGAMSQFGDSTRYSWPGDPDLAREIVHALDAEDIPVVSRDADARLRQGWLDHATIVPLAFIEPSQSVRLVVLSLSFLPYSSHRRLGQLVRESAEKLGRRVAFIASGDMSHRLTPGASAGYSPRAHELDERIAELVSAGRLSELDDIDPDLIEEGGECGLRSIIALGGYAGEDPVPTRLLAYEGPWGVGYLTALVGAAALASATPPAGVKGGMPGHDESEIVGLARRTIEGYVRTGELGSPGQLTGAEYPARAGAFVSLHRGGMLRGCIGTIGPAYDTLAEEVAHNAVEAAMRDPRFPSLTADELDDLDIKVDVLHAPEACTLADLDPATHGVIVTSGWRRGLLLPDLEGVDDVQTQVAIAMQKAGIEQGETCDLQRFRVDRYT